MAQNLERFKADLRKIVSEAEQLRLSMMVRVYGKEKIAKALKVEETHDSISKLPVFTDAYESWYSEALVLVKQLLPDRLADFREHYESPKGRKELTSATYRIKDALEGLQATRGGTVIVDHAAALSHFYQQIAIVMATEKRFESSLFEIRQLVQADLFDSEIDSARELLRGKFLRAAGAVAGVVLEKHLTQVCSDHAVVVAKKHPGISDLNELLKAAGVIDVPQWRYISMLGDIRNLCDHNKAKEPTVEQVTDLIDGTDKVLKTIS